MDQVDCTECAASYSHKMALCPMCNAENPNPPADPEWPEGPAKVDEDCYRCGVKLRYMGSKKFHEGPRLGVLGDLAELLVNKEALLLYSCPQCRRIEFYRGE
ncbi:MAG: hypothetical protein AAF581_04070 [Planctomycetota bacterium]